MTSDSDRQLLLSIARRSIEAVLHRTHPPDLDAEAISEALRRPAGAFVTLNTRGGDLRGCIGSIEPVAPLAEAVVASAINAAFRDPRFEPVTPAELPDLHIEISVMGPIEPVTDFESIVVGRDGLIVRRGSRAGLLLPQVATDYGWDRETFLDHTCMKAGLPTGCWRSSECRVEKFSAEVFGE